MKMMMSRCLQNLKTVNLQTQMIMPQAQEKIMDLNSMKLHLKTNKIGKLVFQRYQSQEYQAAEEATNHKNHLADFNKKAELRKIK